MDRAPIQINPPPDMGVLSPLIAHWQGLRRGRAVPARTDLDPVWLQPWLSGSGILERDGAGRVRFRLGGRALAECLGVEPRGMPIRALFVPDAQDRLARLIGPVFDGPQLLRLLLATETQGPDGRPVRLPCAILPLSDGAGVVNRALVSLDLDPRARVSGACRLQIAQAHLAPLVPPRLRAARLRRGAAPVLQVIAGGRG